MTPQDFITKWSDTGLRERAAAQSHFIDLCKVLGEKAPTDADPKGEWYAFEKGAMKTGGGDGWADVWKRGCFAWEYKSPRKDLNAALKQLQYYVRSLDNPPLLIVSDMYRIELHTNWTNTVHQVHTLVLEELADARLRQKLKWAFSESDVNELKPGKTREALTKEVAHEFVALAQNLRDRGHDPEKVAHFVNRMVFCMFAEDVDLLPDRLFKRMLEASAEEPESFAENAQKLFAAMAKKGGKVGFTQIDWFNGGVFEDDNALPLAKADINTALAAANRNWSNIDPSIMGTLFERGLDPGKRSQLGAHYTDPDKIMLIINPVIVEPLTREWQEAKPDIADLLQRSKTHHHAATKTTLYNQAMNAYQRFIERLASFRILDPACGSGNFLYLALKCLKDIELQVNHEAEAMGLPTALPQTGPENVKGIEINSFAAELARVSVWIGEIQWMREHGFDASRNPILKPLETIECRDALLNADGSEAEWPEADVIIGNPPFLGRQQAIELLGDQYVTTLRSTFEERVPGQADLVAYWFEKARNQISLDGSVRSGLVATNSLRRGVNRQVLDSIAREASIFNAFSDEPWVVEGAAVRVSTICFGASTGQVRLNGKVVGAIGADLEEGISLAGATPLQECDGVAFVGGQKDGPFDISGEEARRLLAMPLNPNGKPNSDVVRPWRNGRDLASRLSDSWIVDFGDRTLEIAQLYEAPFAIVEQRVFPVRQQNRDERRKARWWLHGRPGSRAKAALGNRPSFLATPLTSKHRWFVYLPVAAFPDNTTVLLTKADFTTFGILSSHAHAIWSIKIGNFLGVGNDPRYTPTTCFETFPFPEGLTPNIPAADYAGDPRAKAIAKAAVRLNELRENWLNPPDLVKREPEVVPGYPDRILPVDHTAAAILKKRTLTNLYNQRPAWLDAAHRDIDAAVARAYSWPTDLADEQILERLFRLNQDRAARQ